LDQKEIEGFAKKLDQARKFNCPIKPKRLDIGEAFSIQEEGIKLRRIRGEIITGLKIEGGDDPLWGYLTNQMALVPGCKFSRADSIMPKVRPHLAIYIDCQLRGNITPEDVLKASSGVSAALEILDSRFENVSSLEDEISDNFSTSFYLVGKKRVDPKEIDLKGLKMTMEVNEHIAMSKSLTHDPLIQVAKLSEYLNSRGMDIPAGMVILTGFSMAPIDLFEEMNISLNIDSLGELGLSII